MQNKFSCFYHPTENTELKNIWEDPETVFIFDTNVLLSLYSFQPEGRQDFFKILSKIENRIWIPFHVGLEFQKNRLIVIKKRRNTFHELNKDIDKLIDTLKFDKKPFTAISNLFSLKKNYQSVQEKLDSTFSEINKLFDELKINLKLHLQEIKDEVEILDKDKIFINSDDFIRKEIDELFHDKRIGFNTFDTQEKLDHLYKEGERRYANGIPPGYKDILKEEEFFFDGLRYKSKFGDLIIFKQIIEFSKEKNIKNIVFISEDIKEDWRSVEEFEGRKVLGARPELKRELYREASVKNFLIYQIEEFMKKTDEYLNIKIKEDTLKNIKLSLEEDKHLQFQHAEKLRKKYTLEKLKSERVRKYLRESFETHEDWRDIPIDEYIREQDIFEKYIQDQEENERYIQEQAHIEEQIERYFREQEEIEKEQAELEQQVERHLREQEEIEKGFLKKQAELEEQAEMYLKE
ncbi:PIN-like domain-containing protein [Acinetobacter oleivorans]|uniref:PIN-like domain-containing protein n=1 Tax=Acinetobacter oleivorans TaxID=1148157 RepID=UPI003A897FD1